MPAEPDPTGAEPAGASAPVEHRLSTFETGSFSSARCACGWRGPARRARSRARDDAAAHAESGTEADLLH